MHEKYVVCGAYFIRTNEYYISRGMRAYWGKSIAVAEAMAVGLAAEYLRTAVRLQEGDKADFYIDSESAVKFLGSAVDWSKKHPSAPDMKARLAWWALRDLSKECEVVLHKIYAHEDSLNGNVVADRLAKCGMYLAAKRVNVCTH